MDSKNKISKLWIAPNFRSKFSSDVLYIQGQTQKAWLIADIETEQASWVPKACVSEDNTLMDDKEASEQASRSGRAIDGKLKMPLKHARKNAYDNLINAKLLPYQKDVIETLKGKDKVFLFMEQGLGKTPVSLARLKQMNNGKRTLLICEKSLISQWREEIDKFCPELQDSIDIVNYDVIFRDSKKEWMSQFHDKNFNLILEEVGCLGNENAKRTKKCMELADQAATVQLLTGSMFGAHFEKLYACTRMAGFTWSRKQFDDLFTIKTVVRQRIRTRYGAKAVKNEMIIGYKNIDMLVKAMYEVGAVFLRSRDYLKDLPPMVTKVIKCKQSQESKKLERRTYSNLESITDEELVGMFQKIKIADSLAHNADKLEALKDLIEYSEHRWVIFYSFNEERDILLKLCKKLNKPVSEISGHRKDRKAFDENDNGVIILNRKSGARGFNLQNANYMIFTAPFGADDQTQAEKRINRIGQTKTCFYYILMSDGRFETTQMKDLENRRADVESIG